MATDDRDGRTQRVTDLARSILEPLRLAVEAVALSPTASPTEAERSAYRDSLNAVRALLECRSGSTNRSWAIKDSGLEPDFLAAEHALRVIDALHGPQAAS